MKMFRDAYNGLEWYMLLKQKVITSITESMCSHRSKKLAKKKNACMSKRKKNLILNYFQKLFKIFQRNLNEV